MITDRYMLLNYHDIKSLVWVFLYAYITHFGWTHDFSRCLWCGLSLFAVICYFSLSIAIIVHNSMHVKTFYNSFVEEIWHLLLCVCLGHPVCTYESGHNRSHHRYTQTTYDAMRTSKLRYKWNLLNLILFQPTVAPAVFWMDIRFLWSRWDNMRYFFWKGIGQWLVVIVSQCVLFWMSWKKFLCFVYLPHLFAQMGIVSFNMLQHDGCVTPKPQSSEKEYNMARNFTGPVTNFFFFNNGFHTIHHFYPKMHWSFLPSAHASIAHRIHKNLKQQCMTRYIWRTFVYPGVRVDYLGNILIFDSPEPPDKDWIKNYK